ncbi:MAG: PIN domain-containing protein [Fimbriimonadaceae bacterium]
MDEFSVYKAIDEDQYEEIWKEAIFVFDTNAILDVYRLPSEAANEFLSSVAKIKNRVFTPHHVALEFYRNRAGAMTSHETAARKHRKSCQLILDAVNKACDELSSEKQSEIPSFTKLSDALVKQIEKYGKEIDLAEQKGRFAFDEKEMLTRIEETFFSKRGSAYSLEKVAEIHEEGQARYELERPPGYQDGKSKNKSYYHDGVYYESKYGDLIIWFQILDYCKSNKCKSVIFVTSDQKEDWWWQLNSEGKKNLGARPELKAEFCRVSGGEYLHFYTLDRYLTFAKKFEKVKVSKSSIESAERVGRPALGISMRGRATASVRHYLEHTGWNVLSAGRGKILAVDRSHRVYTNLVFM